MIPDKYQRVHALAHSNVIHRVYANDIIDMLAEVKRLRKELKEAEDVIRYALDRAPRNDDDAKRVFEDFLEVIDND